MRLIIALAALLLTANAASAKVACLAQHGTDAYYQYRIVDGRKCWYRGETRLEKSALAWKQNTPGAPGTTRKVPGVEAVAAAAVMTKTESSGAYPTEWSDSSRPVPSIDIKPASFAERFDVHPLRWFDLISPYVSQRNRRVTIAAVLP